MITVIAHYTAATGAADAVRHCSPGTRLPHVPSRAACSSTAHRGIDNPDEFALVERYVSQAAFAEHRRTPHLRAQRRDRTGRAARRAKLDGVRASSVTPPTTCSPLAVEIDLGELT
jgi:quinol monooxygenase YgiN